jgi:tousled-like kinase
MNDAGINSTNLNKIKSLEARLIGPNSNGLPPVEIFNNENLSDMNSIGDDKNSNKINSNRSLIQSGRKKTTPIKAEKKTRTYKNYQIDFLTTKIRRSNIPESEIQKDEEIEKSENNKNDNISCIEFTSKNLVSTSSILTYMKENKTEKFLSKRERPQELNSDKKIKINTEDYTNPISKLNNEINELKKYLSEKEKENEKSKVKINDLEETVKNISLMNKTLDHQLELNKKSIVKYLKDLEDYRRSHKKRWLVEQEFKLGRSNLQRIGQTTIDVWEEGDEFQKLNQRMKEIEREKLEIEAQKNNLVSFLKRKSNQEIQSDLSDDFLNMKELLSFKMSSLQKEELKIKENYEKLQIDKTLMILERKRIKEEESSRFGSSHNKEKFPILSNRYLILGLLGKGGYSEVYRAYDLENNIEVACKIHQLNSQWSDSIKENYIRHTIRENQIHKEINHSKIVKHYDTIEIDNNSFCSVLELCSGPDLHTYLKMHKTLSEKEARGIISQILSGLYYMNILQRKIIHYDLKPQNIIFHNMEVKISDFGLAKVMDSNCERVELTSQGVGTYWYLPPECFDTSRHAPGISSKVDIWSLGVILYEMIYGARPFGQNCTQDKILKEGIILNAKQVNFPPKPVISKPCKVKNFNFRIL